MPQEASPVTQEHSTTTLLARIAELEAELEAAHTDTAYGCLTRKGLERRYASRVAQSAIIFLDLDDMHTANEKYGYNSCDVRILMSLAVVRNGDNITGRWYSGDEIVLAVPAVAALKIAIRLQAAFQQNGLSATFGIAPAGDDLATSVAIASHKVQKSKATGIRGVILDEGDPDDRA